MATITCPRCGTENPANAMNCKQCRINLKFALENLEKYESPEQREQPAPAHASHIRAMQQSILAWATALPTGWLIGWAIGAAIAYNSYIPHGSIPQNGIQVYRKFAAADGGGRLGGIIGILIGWIVASVITLLALRTVIPALRPSQILWATIWATFPVVLMGLIIGGW